MLQLSVLFSITLALSVLLSQIIRRSVLSTAIVFLASGLLFSYLGWVDLSPSDRLASFIPEVALLSILFADGARISSHQIKSNWKLPFRTLLIGLPLTVILMAFICKLLLNFSWAECFLTGAILSPTDPVFASSLIKNKSLPPQLRDLLNIESGMNDGLAFPLVLMALQFARNQASASFLHLAEEVALGVGIGFLIPWLFSQLEKIPFLGSTEEQQPLLATSIFLLVFEFCLLSHGNEFLGVFVAGVTVKNFLPRTCSSIEKFGESLSEFFKLAATFTFACWLSLATIASLPLQFYLAVVLVLILARPLAMLISLYGSHIRPRDQALVSWFGPKGFASILFSMLLLKEPLANSKNLFHFCALVIAVSIVLHSSTAFLAARKYQQEEFQLSRAT